jgi:hypothetical protein
MPDGERRLRAAAQLRQQAGWCREQGSLLYAALLEAGAADCAAGGPSWAVLEGHEDMPLGDALAIRLLGQVHRLVLRAEAPELARHYPSAGGAWRVGTDAWPAFREVLAAHRERLRERLLRPVQTNEVGRAASLLGGFVRVAEETGLPLRLLEVGASAGLNLRFDRFRYEGDGFAWGDPASPVRLAPVFEGPAPRLAGRVEVAERIGCDAAPLDPGSDEDRLTLRSFLWPDQTARRARLDAALELAARVPVCVERADAFDWLERRLAPTDGVATVVYHSIVMPYFDPEARRRFASRVRRTGEAATRDAPLAWLHLEPAPRAEGTWEHRVRLALWPGGGLRTLATSSPHGPPVRWLEAGAPTAR